MAKLAGSAVGWASSLKKATSHVDRLALRRPYTFVVTALLILITTPFVLLRTPTDIFPAIKIPVVSVIWNYTGLPADQIAQRMVYPRRGAHDNYEHNYSQPEQ